MKKTNDFDKREKRVNIFFKVLYVFAFLLGALILSYVNLFYNNSVNVITINTLIALIAGIFVINTNILRYIFNELKCLKINVNNEDETNYTDNLYENLFFSIVFIAFILSIISSILNFFINDLNYDDNLYWWFTGVTLLYFSSFYLNHKKQQKKFKIAYVINSLIGSIFYFLLFYLPFVKK